MPPEQRKAIQQYVKSLAEGPPAVSTPVSPQQVSDPTQTLAQELAELKRQNQEIMQQNQELAAEIAAMKEEGAAAAAKQAHSVAAAEAAYEKA